MWSASFKINPQFRYILSVEIASYHQDESFLGREHTFDMLYYRICNFVVRKVVYSR